MIFPSPPLSRRLLAVIFFLALAGRLYSLSHTTLFLDIRSDSRVYDELARSLLAGEDYFSTYEPARSYRPPMYPFFLAGVYTIFGHDHTAVRTLQAILGALVAVLTALIATKLAGRQTGIVAGFGTAVYPLLLVLPQSIMTESLYTFLLMLLLWCMSFYKENSHVGLLVWLGFLAGITALTRPVGILFPLMFGIWLAVGSQMPWKKTLYAVCMMSLFLGVTILPWTVRNYRIHHKIIPIATEGGMTIWGANNLMLKPNESRTLEIDNLAERFDKYDEIELDRLGWKNGLAFVLSHPEKYIARCVTRLFVFWNSYLPFYKYRVTWWVLLSVGGVGIIWALSEWRNYLILYLCMLWHIALYVTLHAEPRFHIPLIPLLIIFAAWPLCRLYDKKFQPIWKRYGPQLP